MAMKTRYTNLGGQVVAVKTGGQRYFVEPDALGNVRALVNESGVRAQTYTYWPYGEVRTSSGTVEQPLKFCGTWGYYTESTSKQYVRARYYMQSLGRWQTVDPLWPRVPSLGYVGQNPLFWIDPSGLQAVPDWLPKPRPRPAPKPKRPWWNPDPGPRPKNWPSFFDWPLPPGPPSPRGPWKPKPRPRRLLPGWIPPHNPAEDDHLCGGRLPTSIDDISDHELPLCLVCLAFRGVQADANFEGDKMSHFVAGCLSNIRCWLACPDNVGTYKELDDSIFEGTVSRADALATDDGWDWAKENWAGDWSLGDRFGDDIEFCRYGARRSTWASGDKRLW